jgi:hypothetical protein
MKRSMVSAGLPLVILAFALAGCKGLSTVESYTFRFKIENKCDEAITKVEFLNGPNRSARVLRTITKEIKKNDLFKYEVSGFSEESGTDERYCGVLITYEDCEDPLFDRWQAGSDDPIQVTLTYTYDLWGYKNGWKIEFGTW